MNVEPTTELAESVERTAIAPFAPVICSAFRPYHQESSVTIYHGDCREIVPALGRFDLLLTDPPYGVNFKGKVTKHTKASGGYISGDSEIGPEIVAMCLAKVSRGIVFPGTRLMREYPAWDDCGGVFCPSGAGMGRWGFACVHPILFYGPRPKRTGMWPTGFSSFDNADDCGHPCPKPLRWMSWSIVLAGDDVETILDPFAGSGTTGRAAKDLGKKCVLIEREERYCEIAAKRLAQDVLPLGTQNKQI